MRDKIVPLLRAEGRIRKLDPSSVQELTRFFVQNVKAKATSGMQRHPLGFYYLSEEIDEELSLRYHLWPAAWALPQSQRGGEIHDHHYELNSIILSGSLRQQTFNARNDHYGSHNVFEINYGPMTSRLSATNQRAYLDQETDETFFPGTAYRLAARKAHHVETLTLPAATILLSVAVPHAPSPRVFVPIDLSPPGHFARKQLVPDEQEIVLRTIDLLDT